jgi:hypothetical protein
LGTINIIVGALLSEEFECSFGWEDGYAGHPCLFHSKFSEFIKDQEEPLKIPKKVHDYLTGS